MLKRFLFSKYSLLAFSAILICIGIYFTFNIFLEIFLKVKPPLGEHYDFLAFYSAAYFVLHGMVGKIFDPTTVSNFQLAIVPYKVVAAGYMPYMNPPFVAVFIAPLALFSFNTSRIIWFVMNLIFMGLVAFWITKPLSGKNKALGILLLFGTFPVYQALINGQPSIFILLGCFLAFYFAKKECYYTSGAFLSVLMIKPQLAFFVFVGFLIFRQWRLIVGMVIASLLTILISLPFTGLKLYLDYPQLLFHILISHFNGAGSIIPTDGQGWIDLSGGINGFFTGLFGKSLTVLINIFTLLTSTFLIILFTLATRRLKPSLKDRTSELMLAASITLILLLDPHLYGQDVVLVYLVIPLLIYFKNLLLAIVSVCLVADIFLLDQYTQIHLFPLLLFAFTISVFVWVIRKYDLQGKVIN